MIRNSHAGKKQSGGFSLNVFTDDETYDIHLATLEVLEKTGVFVDDQEARDVFDGFGAVVDQKNKTVKIPPYLVEDAIRSAPSTLFLAGRNPENDIVLESSRVGFTNFGEGIMVVDLYTGELRDSTKADVADSARLVDYLSDVDVYERAICAHDVPQEVGQLHNAEAWLTNTTKHGFMGPYNGLMLKKIIEMGAAVAGGTDKLKERPLISFVTCPSSPLKLEKDNCEIIMESARAGIVINILSMAMAGATSVVTLAGTLVTHNAEILSGVVLNQLTRKGAPVIYGSSTCPMDLWRTTASVGSPECAMISAAVAHMARYYLLPSWVAGG